MISRTLPSCLLAALLGAACAGPPAPDAVVCRDAIHRLCNTPRCVRADEALNLTGVSCEGDLLARTGCGSDDFEFSQPSREEFLQCRVPLLRAGSSSDTHPACSDVEEMLDHCDGVVAFLRTGLP